MVTNVEVGLAVGFQTMAAVLIILLVLMAVAEAGLAAVGQPPAGMVELGAPHVPLVLSLKQWSV